MSPTERIEQVRSSARAASDRQVAEIKENFPNDPDKVFLLITAEMVITEALRPLEQTERKLVVGHLVHIDKVLTDLGL